jgi:hypothetical protein
VGVKIEELLAAHESYSGEGISVRSLEESIQSERGRLDHKVDELNALRSRNGELQGALTEEIDKLREISEQLHAQRGEQGFFARMISKLPGFKDRLATRQSIEELLRRQYEMSAMRVKEAAEFSDRLDVAKSDLFDEIERLNDKIIEYARNERDAAANVLTLDERRTEVEGALALAEPGSLDAREHQAELDKIRRALAEHSALLKLFGTAEERLARLQENTRMLARTIAQLQSDISTYVTIAGEKLDLIAGQIQAIGAAADASMVMLELKKSLEAMTESVNYTTRFVSETQAYFRENVDDMVSELELYDTETEQVLVANLAVNEVYDEMQIADAVSTALAHQIEEAAAKQAAGSTGVVLDVGEEVAAQEAVEVEKEG